MVAAVDHRTRTVPGARIAIAVDTFRVCFFDAHTGAVIGLNGVR